MNTENIASLREYAFFAQLLFKNEQYSKALALISEGASKLNGLNLSEKDLIDSYACLFTYDDLCASIGKKIFSKYVDQKIAEVSATTICFLSSSTLTATQLSFLESIVEPTNNRSLSLFFIGSDRQVKAKEIAAITARFSTANIETRHFKAGLNLVATYEQLVPVLLQNIADTYIFFQDTNAFITSVCSGLNNYIREKKKSASRFFCFNDNRFRYGPLGFQLKNTYHLFSKEEDKQKMELFSGEHHLSFTWNTNLNLIQIRTAFKEGKVDRFLLVHKEWKEWFDPFYYKLTQLKDLVHWSRPFQHYENEGRHKLLNPHYLFDTEWCINHQLCTKENPISSFLKNLKNEGILSPTPYFDGYFYQSNTTVDILRSCKYPIKHYLKFADKNRSPNYLFEAGYYQLQVKEGFNLPYSALKHFVIIGRFLGINPHPFFNLKKSAKHFNQKLSSVFYWFLTKQQYKQTAPHSFIDFHQDDVVFERRIPIELFLEKNI